MDEEKDKDTLKMIIFVVVIVVIIVIAILPEKWFTPKKKSISTPDGAAIEDLVANQTVQIDNKLMEYAETITDADFSWYNDIGITHIGEEGAETLVLDDRSANADMLESYLAEDRGEYDTVVFYELYFLRFIDDMHTMCICTFDNNAGVDRNIVVLKNNQYPFQGLYRGGEEISFVAFADNIRFQTDGDYTIIYAQ